MLGRSRLDRISTTTFGSFLFRSTRAGVTLTENSSSRSIKNPHRASPRHVPAKVIAVADIPRTKSGRSPSSHARGVHGEK